MKLKNALENDKPIPSELKKESEGLIKELEYDDMNTIHPYSYIDDEYNNNSNNDPKILITTSRDPSQRLIQFQKEMRLIIPNSTRINRGNSVVKELVKTCQDYDFTDLVILHENRGTPDGMIISHMPYGPTVYFGMFNVVLRHDLKEEIGNMSEAYPQLIFDSFESRIGMRLVDIMKNLFPVPKMDSMRVMTFVNKDDYISFRHHVFDKKEKNEVDLQEIGPRFELRPYQIMLGTVDMPDSTKEWVLRPYMNTARTKKNL